jgi:Zn-dependent peptidase ImmA (M78 family)
VHRDRPADGPQQRRDPLEREADRFATFFLMPGRLVLIRFKATFAQDRFSLTNETAFALGGLSLDEARRKYPLKRSLSRALASADRFNGSSVTPLAAQFKVSVEAMAIRLEELGLLS